MLHTPPKKVEKILPVNWMYAQPLAQSAKIWGAEAFFFETHPSPKDALSDKDCQIPLTMFPSRT